MGATEFGKFIRKFRLDIDERLLDMAKKLNVSSAFLSSVETGKKPIPQKLIENIKNEYSLSESFFEQLKEAVKKTIEAQKTRNLPVINNHYSQVEQFSRQCSEYDVNDDDMIKIVEFIKTIKEGDTNE